MEEVRYLISDAAARVSVEAHVLRYWEEELELPIPRTQLGHRCYTEENIQTFRNIKELKERGFQLKAIKVLLPELRRKELQKGEGAILRMGEKLAEAAAVGESAEGQTAETCAEGQAAEACAESAGVQGAEACAESAVGQAAEACADGEAARSREQVLSGKDSRELLELDVNLDKLARFESIMENVLRQTLRDNNQELENRISDSVLSGMDARMQLQEEKEEARYRKLDEAIRLHQKQRPGRLVAAAREKRTDAQKKKRFLFF